MPYAVQIYHIRKALDTFEIPYKKPEAMAEGEKQTEKHTEQAEKERKRFSKKIDSLENRENQNGGETGRTGVMLAVFGGIRKNMQRRTEQECNIHTNRCRHQKGRYDKWMEGQKADIRLEEGKEKKRENGIWRNI